MQARPNSRRSLAGSTQPACNHAAHLHVQKGPCNATIQTWPSRCRDRADERRKGVNPDYDGFNTEMNTVSGQTAAVEAALTIDESKFLGGDLEHTHLVKGLDYALLQKVRRRCESG